MPMGIWEKPDTEEVRQRIAALKELGHSGEPEKHSRRALENKETYGLLYEKTARKLLGLGQTRFRRMVLPDRWVVNPAYSTAPKIPVYDPRWLVIVKQALDRKDKLFLQQLEQFTAKRRAKLDDEVRERYAVFIREARRWNERFSDQ